MSNKKLPELWDDVKFLWWAWKQATKLKIINWLLNDDDIDFLIIMNKRLDELEKQLDKRFAD